MVVQDGLLLGSRLTGAVMTGALDLDLKLSNGVIEIEQQLVLKTTDGKYIYVRAAGTGIERTHLRQSLAGRRRLSESLAASDHRRTLFMANQ